MKHKCPIGGCEVGLKASTLMCRQHWYMVPKTLRNAVWLYYRTGTTEQLRAAQEAAIKAVETRLKPAKAGTPYKKG